MKNLSIRSTPVLLVLAVIAIGLVVLVELTKRDAEQDYYTEKIDAASLNYDCQQFLKEKFFPNEVAIDNLNDPNNTGLIGQQFTPITSGRGSLPVKLSTVNPNFSAMLVQQLKDAGLKKGDKVAMCFTGSFPALNIATCAAIESLELDPVLVTSVTSSSWGANSPELTWNDMHQSLYDAKLLSFKPTASSIGGNKDIGQTLSLEGRELAIKSIERNNIQLLNEGFEENIASRMDIFKKHGDIKLFINVGGGVASLGGAENAESIPSGYHDDLKKVDFKNKKGVIYEFQDEEVPFINLLHVQRLMKKYDLPRDPMPLPDVGDGKLYKAEEYHLGIVIGGSIAFILLLISIMIYDQKQNRLGTTIIKNND